MITEKVKKMIEESERRKEKGKGEKVETQLGRLRGLSYRSFLPYVSP
jgi:hypothetical protein